MAKIAKTAKTGPRGGPGRGPLGARFILNRVSTLVGFLEFCFVSKGFRPLPDFQGIRMPLFRGPFRAPPGGPPGGPEGEKSLKSPEIANFHEIH